jgi:hypothetical protein
MVTELEPQARKAMRTFINVSVSALVALGMVVPQFALAAGERSGGFLQRRLRPLGNPSKNT